MQGSGQMLVTGVGMNFQTGIILKLLIDKGQEEQTSGGGGGGAGTDRSISKSVMKGKLEKLATNIGYFGMSILSLFFSSLFTFLLNYSPFLQQVCTSRSLPFSYCRPSLPFKLIYARSSLSIRLT